LYGAKVLPMNWRRHFEPNMNPIFQIKPLKRLTSISNSPSPSSGSNFARFADAAADEFGVPAPD
jgi:hypothetical protein